MTGGLQKRTEGWNVSKAVRSAVGEVRRNMNHYQASHSRNSSANLAKIEKPDPQRKLEELQERNLMLAKMLEGAIQSLRSLKLTSLDDAEAEHGLNIALAKIQFVSMYLSNPDIPVPKGEPGQESRAATPVKQPANNKQNTPVEGEHDDEATDDPTSAPKPTAPAAVTKAQVKASVDTQTRKPAARPSLMDSSFSFMLGEGRHRSSFVSSVATLPEQRRDSESKSRPRKPTAESKTQQQGKDSKSEDNGFTLANIHGGAQG